MPWCRGNEKPKSDGLYLVIVGRTQRYFQLRWWSGKRWTAAQSDAVIAWRTLPPEPEWIEKAVAGARFKELNSEEKALKAALEEG